MKTTKFFALGVLALFPICSFADAAAETAAREAAAVFAGAVESGDLQSLWAALPQSWRTSVGEAAKALGAKAKENPAVWTAARDCLLETSATFAKKSGYAADLLSRTVLPAASGAIASDGSCPAIVRSAAKLGAIAKSATAGTLSGGDVGAMLAAPALSLPGVTDALATPAQVSAGQFAARSGSDGSVTVGIPGASGKSVRMVKTGGKWVPAPLADIFSGCESWKSEIASVSLDGNSAAGVVSALNMMRQTAAAAGRAASQDQFDKSITSAAFPLLLLRTAASGQIGGGGANPADLLKAFVK